MPKRKQKFVTLSIKSAAAVLAKADEALEEAERECGVMLGVAGATPRTRTNTLEPLNRIAIAIKEAQNEASLFSAVHPDVKVRAASETATQKLAKFFPELYLERDVYESVKDVSLVGLDPVAKRFREKELLDFKLSGVDKPPAVRREIKRLIGRAVKLGQAFDRNIKDDVRWINVLVNDLAGLPDDFKKAHPVSSVGTVKISTNYPDYFPFMRYASSGKAREQLYRAFSNRGWPKNDQIFHELLSVRQRLAKLVGYKNWADYATVDKMTGSAKTVDAFLSHIADLTQSRCAADYKMLLERKRKDEPRAARVNTWEYGYYENVIVKERVGFDAQEARQYFQFAKVKQGVFAATEQLFGLSYERAHATAWHEDVEVYDVYRQGASSKKSGKKLIGRFYLDLHPREGKYGHAACFDIRPGIRDRQLPEAALICNFSRDLMEHSDVTTFFHEFGHLIHFILGGDQEWARFSGFATEWDFVEAPSQMLEEWAWDLETLRQFAIHPKSGKPIPEDMVERMRRADGFGRGIWLRTQVFYSMLSLRYHTASIRKNEALLNLLKREQKKYSAFAYVPGTHFYANFGHLNGYSAIYYTYLWSRAIGEDLLSRFRREGLYNAAVSRQYADRILAPGGSKDARELIKNFLGREWSLKGFERWVNRAT